jgi:hypothetical protein
MSKSTTQTITNLTPNDASVDLADGRTLGLPRLLDDVGSPRVARAVRVPVPEDPVDLGWTRVPTSTSRLMGTSGLPDPAPGAWLLVTEAVAEAAYHSGRDCSDLLVLDSEAGDRGIRRALRRWTPTCSLRVHLDYLRRCAATLTQEEVGYAALEQSMDDVVTRRVSEVASCLLASMAPAPGDPSTYAQRALAIAVDLLRISQEREAWHQGH